jgi:hypothetical protein
MMRPTLLSVCMLFGCLELGCESQQYVDPDTVALIVTESEGGRQRVNRCHYIPVLLGSQIKFRYEVDADIDVTLTITRDEVDVHFEGGGFSERSVVDASDLTDMQTTAIDWASEQYVAELIAGCTPDDEYRP